MTRYLEIVFRSRLRLLVLVVLLPLALSAVNLYLWRSYEATLVVWVDDPATFGQSAAAAIGYNPYQTPSQNAARLFSNLLGTQSFNNALVDKLAADDVIHSDRERASVIASLSQLTVTPGGAASSGSGGGSSASSGGSVAGDHTLTLHYVCPKEDFCLRLLPVALDVYRTQYQDLKARAAATARAIYEPQLAAAQAKLAAAIAAVQHYEALHPQSSAHSLSQSDPVLTSLQHDVDQAQKDVDTANAQLSGIDTLTQVSNGISGDMFVVDGPRTQKGLFGVKGLRSDNLKTDVTALAACLVAAAAYLILVAFLDRTIRGPNEIKNRLGIRVVTIPVYQSGTKSRKLKLSA